MIAHRRSPLCARWNKKSSCTGELDRVLHVRDVDLKPGGHLAVHRVNEIGLLQDMKNAQVLDAGHRAQYGTSFLAGALVCMADR
jgi:hypothetical protein